MKKLFFALLLLFPLVFISCGDDDDEIDTSKEYEVRYEASCSDPENYELKVRYPVKVEGVGLTTKEETVSSPFVKEIKLNNGSLASITVNLVKKENKESGVTGVSAKIYVNEKLLSEDTGNYNAFASILLLDY